MKKTIAELRKIMRFKETTEVGDIVLIAAKNPDMLLYAVVRTIERDDSRRDDWWRVGMTILSVPPQPVLWTLRQPQMTGQEIFTMGGDERFMQAIAASPEEEPEVKGIKPIRRIK
ncbi:MAG: hypothetical protein LBH14_07590 [Desulfobulbaceae bacterium]|jgi:hypothetical protein|nr:hypothetical protein [Desulfobulbaceae bacterium]